MIYGDRCRFSSARLEGGFEVVIRLPLEFRPEKDISAESLPGERVEPVRKSGQSAS